MGPMKVVSDLLMHSNWPPDGESSCETQQSCSGARALAVTPVDSQ